VPLAYEEEKAPIKIGKISLPIRGKAFMEGQSMQEVKSAKVDTPDLRMEGHKLLRRRR